MALFAGIGRLDDRAHGLLVEPFEAAFALQVLQMASNGALTNKLVELLFVDQPGDQEASRPLAADRPSFSIRERLLEKRKIGKRFHRGDTFNSQLVAQQIMIKATFEVMHAGVEKALAVQPDPKSNRA